MRKEILKYTSPVGYVSVLRHVPMKHLRYVQKHYPCYRIRYYTATKETHLAAADNFAVYIA